ncbi:hypothetical protein FO488_12850 [Geobacter sp. FeAm09]|uniref:hypothetical protein n=1 Tax=Geobacter sp. FeAm09 TaxID=2597769 RepID=UPI0011EE38D9|nr:hypothetical protein [Geobacter sp. FeAm09]QEM68957.1 hypothetical protein FO488_12850 [Geobacter sp. FeAm09]
MNIKTTALSLATAALLLCVALAAFAVESNKPASHDATWLHNHGAASKVKLAECLECHADRVSCIQCHQEVQPRNHTGAWTRKGHGLEARWDRSSCLACHKEDSCIECHQNTPPASHRSGWSSGHCTQCHKPVQESTCFVCHKTTPHN